MSRNVQIVLLCEDTQHEAFARRFLKAMGWSTRRMRVEKGSGRGGSAEQFVRERFPTELAAYRSKRGAVGQALIVVIDGDRGGVPARHQELDAACEAKSCNPREPDEHVAVFVPTWRIETWFAYLDGQSVDETKTDYPRVRRERECQRHVDVLADMCRTDLRPVQQPNSGGGRVVGRELLHMPGTCFALDPSAASGRPRVELTRFRRHCTLWGSKASRIRGSRRRLRRQRRCADESVRETTSGWNSR